MRNPDATRDRALPVWVEPDARLAPHVSLSPFVYIGHDVEIGTGTLIGPNVSIVGPARIGARVRIGPGTAVGWDGFGYEKHGEEYALLEHTGPVVIEDDVHIGANVTIARARTGRETRIGRGTKIDSLVHIGHNVTIGRNCVIVAQVGVSGSVQVGNSVVLAGQVGIKDHVCIGDNSVIYAKSALFRSIPAGSQYSGIPARPHDRTKRFWARLWRRFGGEE